MRSNPPVNQASGLLKYAAIGGLLFLHIPILFIFLYAFTSESKSYQFPVSYTHLTLPTKRIV